MGFNNLAVGCCGCCEVCVIVRRQETGEPIAGVLVTVRDLDVNNGAGLDLPTKTTGEDGRACAQLATTKRYSIHIKIPTPWTDGETPIFAEFTTTIYQNAFDPVRPCTKVHEYDFCTAQFLLQNAPPGLHRFGAGSYTRGWEFYTGNAANGIQSGIVNSAGTPSRFMSYYQYFQAEFMAGITLSGPSPLPDRGIGHGGASYGDYWFMVIERPYTLASPMRWRWVVNPPLVLNQCDQSAARKPSCGNQYIACDQTMTAEATSFQFGSEWATSPNILADGLSGTTCGWTCETFPYGQNVNMDDDPFGLIRKTLYCHIFTNDDVNSIGTLEETAVPMYCQWNSQYGYLFWESEPIGNDAGGYTYYDVQTGNFVKKTPYFVQTMIRLDRVLIAGFDGVERPQGYQIFVTNTGDPNPMPAEASLPSFTKTGAGFKSDWSFNGRFCHPTLLYWSGPDSIGYNEGVRGSVTE